ncbi:hypothetical protein [Salmonella bongori]|uniref:hypothetical protein n=1 Tax=Salmonella bongori TaxID=54736 RepID=UPI00211755CF|nr:hypothetical protein [Salmonella bongori]
MMKPISAGCPAIRSVIPGTTTTDASPGLSKDLVGVANIAYGTSPFGQKSGMLLVTGEKGFNESVCLNMLGQQIPRVFSGKPLYPSVFLTQAAVSEFEKAIENPYKSMSGDIDLEKYDNDHNCGTAVGIVAQQQENLTLGEVTLGEFRKVYITGHGSAGIDALGSGGSVYTAKELVDILVAHNILDQIKDIRLVSCYSADKRRPASFTQEDIEKANRPPGFFEKMLLGARTSFMEKVADEIWRRGYTDVKVSGYHGAGVFYTGDIPFTHLRSTTIPATLTIKRETVRETLESQID